MHSLPPCSTDAKGRDRWKVLGSRKDLYDPKTGVFKGFIYTQAEDIDNARYVFTDPNNNTGARAVWRWGQAGGARGENGRARGLAGGRAGVGGAHAMAPLSAARERIHHLPYFPCSRRVGRRHQGQPGDV